MVVDWASAVLGAVVLGSFSGFLYQPQLRLVLGLLGPVSSFLVFVLRRFRPHLSSAFSLGFGDLGAGCFAQR